MRRDAPPIVQRGLKCRCEEGRVGVARQVARDYSQSSVARSISQGGKFHAVTVSSIDSAAAELHIGYCMSPNGAASLVSNLALRKRLHISLAQFLVHRQQRLTGSF